MGAGMLTNDQKRTWLDISRYLLSRYEDDPGDLIWSQKSHPRVTQYGSNEGVIEALNKYLGNHEKAILKG